jgi:protease I
MSRSARRFCVWAALAAIITLTTGCGGGSEEPPGGGGTPSPSGGSTGGPAAPGGAAGSGVPMPAAGDAARRVLFVLAAKDFQDLELKDARDALVAKGCTVTVASSTLNEARGMEGTRERPSLLLADARAADYAAVVFIGGEGANEYFDLLAAHALAKEAHAAGKVVAAICIAPSTLARAGLLAGRKATCDYGQQQDLKAHGATIVEENVVRDGKIITANGPYAARQFGEEIAKALTGD